MILRIDKKLQRYRDLKTFEDGTLEFLILFKEYLNKNESVKMQYFLGSKNLDPGVYYFVTVRDANYKEYIIPVKCNNDSNELNNFEFSDSIQVEFI